MSYTDFKDQNYERLKKECEKTGVLFEDPEFPAADSSLYYSKEAPFAAEWLRPTEITPDARMFLDGAESADVSQGKVGNCWFVAAAATLALENDLLKKVIPDWYEDEFVKGYCGIFRFRFWRFGVWTEVVVDDRLPTYDGKLVYAKSRDSNEFWSALLEKAYAKLAGSYEALEAGNPADALVDFTGGVSEQIDLVKGDHANNLEVRAELHHRLRKLLENNTMASASIKIINRDEMEQQLDTGLVKGHAYGISTIKTVKLGGLFNKFNAEKLYMVKLRNPWGMKEWNGAWSDESEDWNRLSEEEREELCIKVENDGEFWMSWLDFCTHFTTLNICVLVNTSFFSLGTTYDEGALKGKWEVGTSAGGCINNKETYLQNPQYRFDITGSEKDAAFVSVMQPDVRNLKTIGESNKTLGFYVMKVEMNRKQRVHQMMYIKQAMSAFSNARELFLRLDLDPGRYVVIPSTFAPDIEGEFLIRVYTDKENQMKELITDVPEKPTFGKAPTHQVSILVTNVNELVRKGVSLTVDPYCVIECDGKKITTARRNDNENPEFNDGALFYVNDVDTAKLKITVWDRNAMPVPDTFLGVVEFPLAVNDSVQVFTKELMDKTNDEGQVPVGGKVTFRYCCSASLDFL